MEQTRQCNAGGMVDISELNPYEHAITLAHNDLLAYMRLQYPRYQIGLHHLMIADALMAVERGEIKRLIIEAPPRHGKSMQTSEFFPAWYMGRNPEHYIIAATYAQELADDFGRKVRNQLQSPEHQLVFPDCRIAADSQAASKFATEQGGNYFAVGVGGAGTGRGAHLFIIDDPLKGRQEADSDLTRRRLKEWYASVAYTRLMPGGAIIIMATRWHEDDLTGWVLREHEHEGWHRLSLPAINDVGEALWPDAYPLQRLEAIRKTLGIREWNALYQQKPQPDEGNYFKRDMFKWYENAPKHLNIYAASDFAVTEDGGDYTEHGIFGVCPDGNIYVLDWWYGQTTPDVWIETMLDLAKKWSPSMWFAEAGVIRRSVEPFLKKRMMERKDWQPIQWEASISDKPSRCRSIQAQASMGKLYLPKNAEWIGRILSQLLAFPSAVHDDAADVFGLFGRGIDNTRSATQPKETKKEDIQPGSIAWILAQTKEEQPRSKYRA